MLVVAFEHLVLVQNMLETTPDNALLARLGLQYLAPAHFPRISLGNPDLRCKVGSCSRRPK